MSLAFFPKSLQNKFGFCLGSQRQLPKRDNTLYLWPRSKGWMRAVKRTFNHAATKVTNIGYALSLGAVFGCLCKLRIYFEKDLTGCTPFIFRSSSAPQPHKSGL